MLGTFYDAYAFNQASRLGHKFADPCGARRRIPRAARLGHRRSSRDEVRPPGPSTSRCRSASERGCATARSTTPRERPPLRQARSRTCTPVPRRQGLQPARIADWDVGPCRRPRLCSPGQRSPSPSSSSSWRRRRRAASPPTKEYGGGSPPSTPGRSLRRCRTGRRRRSTRGSTTRDVGGDAIGANDWYGTSRASTTCRISSTGTTWRWRASAALADASTRRSVAGTRAG